MYCNYISHCSKLCKYFIVDDNDILQATNLLCVRYTQNRFIPSVDDWPPYHPKHYTPLTIIHHGQVRTESEVKNIAQKTSTTDIWSEMHCCSEVYTNAIKNISDLLVPFENTPSIPYMILIEGAPGIGKTELSKEIALQWANKSILKAKKLLFLLFACDPHITQITNIQLLVKYFCQGDTLSNKITDWLVKTDGKYLTIIFDGYDEMSTDSCIINDIIAHQVLTQCSIVITSRPIASSRLHRIVNCRAEVLGFTEKDRQDFINSALQDQNEKIKELNEYLIANQHLNFLCFIPLNMSILLCLAKDRTDALPKTQTILYKNFILMTITHFLNKDKLLPTTSIAQFIDLPHPYDQILKELSQFAFFALRKDKLVFTLAEVKAECPNLTPANWYGLGLLKPARYFKARDGCDHESFHFLHYSIQEYMAAYYIASLSDKKLLSLLRETFWDVHYFNTWIMYVGITGGKHHVFAQFLSGNIIVSSWLSTPKVISKRLSNNKIKCLHLLRCSVEADCEILSSVENIFKGQIIDLSNNNLSVNDIYTLAVSLLRSPNKEWEVLNLSQCNIDDNGCNLFYELFHSQRVTFKIKKVDISYNNIQWESLSKLFEIFKLWQTKDLVISVDALYDDATNRAINSFTDNVKKIIQPYFTRRVYSDTILFTYLAERQTMIVVHLDPNFHIKSYQLDNCRIEFKYYTMITLNDFIRRHNIDIRFVSHVVFNYRISYNEANIKSTLLSQHVQKVTFCGSNMHSKGVYLMNIPSAIRHNDKPYQRVADYLAAVLCHNILTNSSYIKALPEAVANAVNSNFKRTLNLKLCDATNNNVGKEAADDIATILCYNTRLEQLNLGGNNLQSAGAIKIAKALQSTMKVTWLNLSSNNITEEAAVDIAAVLSHNTLLQTLDLGRNNLQSAGAIEIARALQNTVNLTWLNLSSNNISEEAVDDIAAVLSHNIKLKTIELGQNNLQSAGVIKIARALQNTVNLTSLGLSDNNVTEEAADAIAAVLSHNSNLQKLYLGGNNLQSVGTIKIARALQNTVNLILLNLSSNNISEEAADDIATVLSRNTKLQELYLSGNNLQSAGAIKIAKALQSAVDLTRLKLFNNNISEETLDLIAAMGL